MISLARVRQAVLGWVYAPCCGGCDRPLSAARQCELPFLCEACEEALIALGSDGCRVCGQHYESPMTTSFRCANCGDREIAFDFAVSAYRSGDLARELMHRYKYGKQLHLSRTMGSLVQRVWEDERLRRNDWWVVPVPLHPKRQRQRGFNQAHELAVELIRQSPPDLRLTLKPLLKRVQHTVRQAQLDRRERLLNPQEAFAMRRAAKVEPPEGTGLLIIDDVLTTGSTASACAALLRQNSNADVIAAISPMRG